MKLNVITTAIVFKVQTDHIRCAITQMDETLQFIPYSPLYWPVFFLCICFNLFITDLFFFQNLNLACADCKIKGKRKQDNFQGTCTAQLKNKKQRPMGHISHLANNSFNKISFMEPYIKQLDNVVKQILYKTDLNDLFSLHILMLWGSLHLEKVSQIRRNLLDYDRERDA